VAHTCNPRYSGGPWFKAQANRLRELISKKKKKKKGWSGSRYRACIQTQGPGMVVHTCNPSTPEAGAGGSPVSDQIELHSKTLPQFLFICSLRV
jgi:hypothetical protein